MRPGTSLTRFDEVLPRPDHDRWRWIWVQLIANGRIPIQAIIAAIEANEALVAQGV
jgi:hypothetical protein